MQVVGPEPKVDPVQTKADGDVGLVGCPAVCLQGTELTLLAFSGFVSCRVVVQIARTKLGKVANKPPHKILPLAFHILRGSPIDQLAPIECNDLIFQFV
jgi:hypothetical protein